MPIRVRLLVLLVMCAAITLASGCDKIVLQIPRGESYAPGDYLFCFWNVENLFDDSDDNHNRTDDPYDNWMARNPNVLDLKLTKLSDVLCALKNGQGPDVLALSEVESLRAAQLLMEKLNQRLKEDRLQYKYVAFKPVRVGRAFSTAIISRVPIQKKRTKQLGGKVMRTLRAVVGPPELVVITSHWRSRRSSGGSNDDGADRRAEYADVIYGEYHAMFKANPKVDLLVCGDFNDDPSDPSVTEHLKAIGDLERVRRSNAPQPYLFNLMSSKLVERDRYGTLYYKGWHIFDQIIVSPGMLDEEGWSCKPETVTTVRRVSTRQGKVLSLQDPRSRYGRPWRFGDATDDPTRRGYSDHFPVIVVLRVHERN